jgi:arylsulfatase A-like enzyme
MADMGMPPGELTIAELLKLRGYHTVHIGKWHLGESDGMRPEQQGFDESLGFMPAASKYEADTAVAAKLEGDPLDRFLWMVLTDAVQFNGGPMFHAGQYLTDYFGDQATRVVQANRNRPFFLYLAFNAPHSPMQSTPDDFAALSTIKDRKTRVYGAMIRALDRNVGKVMKALRAAGVDRNTVVIFTSDNGGAAYVGLPSNRPFRGWKGTFFEGGIRVPLFMRWPLGIRAGTRIEVPTQHIDMFPTIAAAAGAALPRNRVIDGMNLLPLMRNHAHVSRTLFWRSGGYEAVRDGDWKLQVSPNPPRLWLFNLAADATEQHNLASNRPDQVMRLRQELVRHDRQMAKPLWPALLEEPIRIDVPADAPWSWDQEYVYWPN